MATDLMATDLFCASRYPLNLNPLAAPDTTASGSALLGRPDPFAIASTNSSQLATSSSSSSSSSSLTTSVASSPATVDISRRPIPIATVTTPTVVAVPGISAPLLISNLAFTGKEGDSGTFQIRLNQAQAPVSNVTVTFTTGNFLVVDADGIVSNGTQSSWTFTPQDWNQNHTVWFIAEDDNVSTDRITGNTFSYSLTTSPPSTTIGTTTIGTTTIGTTVASEIIGSGTYDLGKIVNTYAPDPNHFNIDLDFRNDVSAFWTPARQAIAQKAANDWASHIANEWTGLSLNNAIPLLQGGVYSTNTFTTKRYVDDVLVFVSSFNSGGTAGGFGGPEYSIGGWLTSPQLMPRVGQIQIDPAVGDTYLYNAIVHELGHVLGLVGLNWAGYLQQDLTTPQTAVFKGAYSTAANGGQYIPLQSQDGANSVTGQYDYWHPANSVKSIMSYGWLYSLSAPSAIDYAMLADSGYQVYGVNAPIPTVAVASIVEPTVPVPVTSAIAV